MNNNKQDKNKEQVFIHVATPQATLRNAVEDWKAFSPNDIPTKGIHLPSLFYSTLDRLREKKHQTIKNNKNKHHSGGLRILEVGCGCGTLCEWLLQQDQANHYQDKIVGIDVNPMAIQVAQERCRSFCNGTFHVADATSDADWNRFLPSQNTTTTTTNDTNTATLSDTISSKNEDDQEEEVLFDFIILQLFLSIVGTLSDRQKALSNVLCNLERDGGTIYMSCSGVSEDINPKYQQLYQQDGPITGEPFTYFSRAGTTTSSENDNGDDNILYMTHHFTTKELNHLLTSVGFTNITIEQKMETSSRRPNEAAYFLYATAQRNKL